MSCLDVPPSADDTGFPRQSDPSASRRAVQDGTLWKDSTFLRSQLAEARKFVEECAGNEFQEYIEHSVFDDGSSFRPPLESVLEGAFYLWWEALVGHGGHLGRSLNLVCQRVVSLPHAIYRLDFSIEPAYAYADEIANAGLVWPAIAVEVDGHTFHEKTKEQVTYRNQRDRDLQQAGWKVLHLSYDEIDKDGANACAGVIAIVRDQFIALNSAIYRQHRTL